MSVAVVGPTPTLGVRKAKNFKLDMVGDSAIPSYWAILYIPEGINPDTGLTVGGVTAAGSSIYEPNQHVIMFGVCSSGSPVHQFSSLSRNLNSGDQIVLVAQGVAEGVVNLRGIVSFVIAFN
jgi:hypothetical protein